MADKGFLFFRDWADPLRQLSGDEFKELFFAMYDFQMEDAVPPKFDGTLGIIAAFVFPQLERRKASSEAGKAGMQKRWKEGTNKHPNKGVNKGGNNKLVTQDIDIDIDVDVDDNTPPAPSKGESHTTTREKRFKPPTVDEVREYCESRKNNVEPQRFVDYYTANGWRVGRSPMKDWRAAVRNWENNAGRGVSSCGAPLEQSHPAAEWDEFYELALRRGTEV